MTQRSKFTNLITFVDELCKGVSPIEVDNLKKWYNNSSSYSTETLISVKQFLEFIKNNISGLEFEKIVYIYAELDSVKKFSHISVLSRFIVSIVCHIYCIALTDIINGGKRNHTEAKKLAMYLLKEEKLSLPEIGKVFNNFAKGSSHRHIQDVKDWLSNPKSNQDIVEKIEILSNQITQYKIELFNRNYEA